ncbi:MAG: hypothetical protein JKY21_03395 [Alcanivorax sp.]|nr:hypothetical protein [Alcanivorax sp.]
MRNLEIKWLPGAGLVLMVGALVACDPIEPPENQEGGQTMTQPGQTQQPGQTGQTGGYNSGQQQQQTEQ